MKVKTQVNNGSAEENVITTRFRAAQQQQRLQSSSQSSLGSAQQQQSIDTSFSLSKSHRINQHAIGKIVKPIPVRPLSSSSSSTHSSTFSGSLIKPLIPNMDTTNPQLFQSSNFSLIAKYFASFPATRLKTAESASSTPFLPFSKAKSDDQSNQISTQTLSTHLQSENNLCTNFRRMIKLNEEKRSETPMGNEGDEGPRFSQITMETRSTRKFIIKHHPYLQQQQQISKSPKIERPSINLIKMKKLKGQKSVENNDEDELTPLNNRSGRSSRSNNSGNVNCEVDDLLVKFTDKAPINTQNKKSLKKKKVKEENELSSSDCDECCENNEEDSSGYYSSYHSVDLISSAGGSVNGEKQKLNETKLTSNTINNINRPSLHHYPTRYVSNFLQSQNSPKNNNSNGRKANLRHKNPECDIDIDQIEND